ncbi:MAG TPA: hypothetical protein VGQ59_08385 [Cyclobacteriaceae bacterium]|nr:hypothetical protein [Cyclobacteriaceae bacterium]
MKLLLKIYLWSRIAVAVYLFVMNCMAMYRQIEAGFFHRRGLIMGVILASCISFFYSYFLSFSSYSELTNRKQLSIKTKILGIASGIIMIIFFYAVPHPDWITILLGCMLALFGAMDIIRLVIKKHDDTTFRGSEEDILDGFLN